MDTIDYNQLYPCLFLRNDEATKETTNNQQYSQKSTQSDDG